MLFGRVASYSSGVETSKSQVGSSSLCLRVQASVLRARIWEFGLGRAPGLDDDGDDVSLSCFCYDSSCMRMIMMTMMKLDFSRSNQRRCGRNTTLVAAVAEVE